MVLEWASGVVSHSERYRKEMRHGYSKEEERILIEQGFSVDVFTAVFAAGNWAYDGYEIVKSQASYHCYKYEKGILEDTAMPQKATSLESAIEVIQSDIGVTGFKGKIPSC